MSDKLIIAMLISFCTLGAAIGSSPFRESLRSDNTEISIHIDDHKIKFTTSFPKDQSRKVHEYLRQALHLTDLSDLSNLEIKQYKTPDNLYSMHIKSRNGYFNMVMKRSENPPGAADHAKMICEGVKKILADK